MLVVSLILFIHTSGNATAHLAGGTDIKQGETLIDIGYDPEPIVAETPVFILISVQNSTTEQEINTSSLWVRLDDPIKKTLFSGKLVREPTGAYTMMVNFPEKGEYTINMRFSTPQGTIEGEATLQVQKQESMMRKILLGSSIVTGILIGLVCTVIRIRRIMKT